MGLSSVLLIGRGRLGSALAKHLKRAGIRVDVHAGRAAAEGRFSRSFARKLARAEVILLAVPDRAVEPTARAIFEQGISPRAALLHSAGAVSPDVLEPFARERAVWHPLTALAPKNSALRTNPFAGVAFTIAGTGTAKAIAAALVRALKGRVIRARVGVDYHRAASMAANGTAALAANAVAEIVALGASRADATYAVAALLQSVVNGLRHAGPERALTGPIARGDVETVRAHLASLKTPRQRERYVAIARLILDVARKGELTAKSANEIERQLEQGVGGRLNKVAKKHSKPVRNAKP